MDIFSKITGCISDYDIIVIGHQRCNRYFGENPDAPPRGLPATCTSTLIKGIDFNGKPYVLLVDPTVRVTAEDFYFDINRRTGLHMEDITHCFATHEHFDHQIGLNYFPNAKWMVAEPLVHELKRSTLIDATKVVGVKAEFLPGVFAVPLPGHTDALHGVAFKFEGKRIVVAGDSVMTKFHFRHNTTEFESNTEMAVQTIIDIKKNFDIVIPGHDNLIIVSNSPLG